MQSGSTRLVKKPLPGSEVDLCGAPGATKQHQNIKRLDSLNHFLFDILTNCLEHAQRSACMLHDRCPWRFSSIDCYLHLSFPLKVQHYRDEHNGITVMASSI